ncbi:MAG: A24 family peptidase [Pseudomonadota bacterium]|nr:A24 family peptidase [Pseudomonadota bacterium]
MSTAVLTNGILYLVLALVLVIAAYTDLRHQRLPNVLTAGAAVCGFGLQGWYLGLSGLGIALGGFGVGLIGFLPFYLKGGMGAGDIKLMASAGTFLGAKLSLIAIAYTLIAGMVFGLAYAAWRGGAWSMLQRYMATLRFLAVTGTVSHTGPPPGEVAAQRFPYAVPIAIGTLSALMWPIF